MASLVSWVPVKVEANWSFTCSCFAFWSDIYGLFLVSLKFSKFIDFCLVFIILYWFSLASLFKVWEVESVFMSSDFKIIIKVYYLFILFSSLVTLKIYMFVLGFPYLWSSPLTFPPLLCVSIRHFFFVCHQILCYFLFLKWLFISVVFYSSVSLF